MDPFSTQRTLTGWNNGNPDHKGIFILGKRQISSSFMKTNKFSATFDRLIINLRCMFKPVVIAVDKAIHEYGHVKPMEHFKNQQDYESLAQAAYRQFLDYVDTAIKTIEVIEGTDNSTTHTAPIPPSLSVSPVTSDSEDSDISQPSPSPSHLVLPSSVYPSSSSSQGSKRRLSATSLADTEQDGPEAGDTDRDMPPGSELHPEASRQKDRKRRRGE